jgi:transposase
MIFDLTKEISRKLVKLDACLQRTNIRISNYVSNSNSKGYTGVIEKLLKGIIDSYELVKSIHGRTLNRVGRKVILASLCGVLTPVDIYIIRFYKEELDLANKHKAECQQKMNLLCNEHFPRQIKALQTILGVKERSATAIIAEVGVDMNHFEKSSALVSWCGLKPRNDESAGKIKSRQITHGNKFLRKSLIECAWAVSKTQNCFYNRFCFIQTNVRKKNKMKVQVAIARKLLTVVWYLLKEGGVYRELINPEKVA